MGKRHKSQLGVKADTKECIIWKGSVTGGGYPVKWRAGRTRMYCRLLWEDTHGRIPKGYCVCHRCDNTRCVNINHLFLGTYADNTRDMWLKGRGGWLKGEAHGRAVMTEKKVKEMRKKYRNGVRIKELSEEFGLSRTATHKVVYRMTWTHVE